MRRRAAAAVRRFHSELVSLGARSELHVQLHRLLELLLALHGLPDVRLEAPEPKVIGSSPIGRTTPSNKLQRRASEWAVWSTVGFRLSASRQPRESSASPGEDPGMAADQGCFGRGTWSSGAPRGISGSRRRLAW